MKIIIIFVLCGLCSIPTVCALQEILTLVDRLSAIMKNISNTTSTASTTESLIHEMHNPHTKIGEAILELNAVIAEIQELKINENTTVIFNMISRAIPRELVLSIYQLHLHHWISVIDSVFDRLLLHIKQDAGTSMQTWKDLSGHIMNSTEAKLKSLQTELYPERTVATYPGTIFTFVDISSRLQYRHCIASSMMRYTLAHLFAKMVVTEVKGVAALIYASMIENPEDNGWRSQIASIKRNFEDRVRIYESRTRVAMRGAPKYIRACDPVNGTWIRDKNYFEMERIEQVTIFQFNSFMRTKTCDNAISQNLVKYDVESDACDGTISDCEYSKVLEVCRLDNTTKRYQWIKSDEASYGINSDACPNGEISRYNGASNWLNSHCICKCRQTDRNWISTQPVMADVANNMVVTGLRFIRKNGILHMQIKEGQLLPNGWTNSSTQNWVPIPEAIGIATINATSNKFYLDDIVLPVDHVVVGVQFVKNDGFFIKVIGAKFNHATGQLQSSIMNHAVNHAGYQQLELPGQNSIYTNRPHIIGSQKKWVELKLSDWKHDAGQSMLPLFDGVAVETDPPLPIGGVGIFHKAVEDYAGFISPRLSPIRYSKILADHVLRSLSSQAGHEEEPAILAFFED